jgi:hypothetical protein
VRFFLISLLLGGHHSPPPPAAGAEPEAKSGCDETKKPSGSDEICYCDGYHGGIPPQPGVNYDHWECGKKRHRTDGCPDDIADKMTCTGTPASCPALQGPFCGQLFECKDGHWDGQRNTCSEIP